MKKPWIMAQTWRDLVFLHWPIAPDALRPFVPAELEIDLFDGQAWVGVVPFVAAHTRMRFSLPFPIAGTYRELNVRTYVRYKGRSGVYFFSLDADSQLAVKAASAGGFLPYRYARMKIVKKGRRYAFASHLAKPGSGENFRVGFTPGDNILKTSELEKWLTERYCLWTKPKAALYRVEIDHAPWRLQKVHTEIAENSLAGFLPSGWNMEEPLAHFSAEQKTRFYPPVKEHT
ncbi:YqjF family protein [Planococcus sp. SSTMD024]|uniref:YqjF family protein n=1 Tax=Planococcus sp. SSTMD024 TaxID=3242163 RepID=UPI00351E951E